MLWHQYSLPITFSISCTVNKMMSQLYVGMQDWQYDDIIKLGECFLDRPTLLTPFKAISKKTDERERGDLFQCCQKCKWNVEQNLFSSGLILNDTSFVPYVLH